MKAHAFGEKRELSSSRIKIEESNILGYQTTDHKNLTLVPGPGSFKLD